jgi:group I intron endonuclease
MKKYGILNFKIEQLDTANSVQELDLKESYWINFLDSMNPKNGYNARAGGNKTTFSKETREKMSLSKKGKPSNKKDFKCSPETALKISIANKGRTAWNKGIPQREDLKLKQSEFMKGKSPTNKGQYQYIPIIRIDVTTGETLNFNNKQTAADSIGVSRARVDQVLRGIFPIIRNKYTFKLDKEI